MSMRANGNYTVTGWAGSGRRPISNSLKASQFRGMGYASVFSRPEKETIINNYYGTGYQYDCCCENNDDGMSPLTKLLFGLGIGTNFLGTLLGLIKGGGDKTEGAGDSGKTKETKQTEEKETPKAEEKKTEEKKAEEKKEEVKPTQELKDGSEISVIDDKLGPSSKISGTVTNNADGTVSITDVINTYTYKKTGTKIYNGKEYPVYSLQGATNNATGKAVNTTQQEYILIDGQLKQPADLDLAGTGTGSIAKGAANSQTRVGGGATQKADSTDKSEKSEKSKSSEKANNKPKIAQWKATYTVTTKSGRKYSVKQDHRGKYHYFDEKNNEMQEPEFKAKTGIENGEAVANKYKMRKAYQQSQNNKKTDSTQYSAKISKEPGKYTTATFKDSSGKTHTYTGRTSGISFSPSTRRAAEIEDIKRQMKADGFTNVTLS